MGASYRADQVGSFLRPAELLKARQEGADPQRLRAMEDRHVQRVLAKQKELGFEIFTDGELRRRNFMSDLIDAVEGFDTGDAVARSWKGSAGVAVSSVTGVVTGKLRQRGRMTAHELAFLRMHSPGAIKITLPTANQFPAIAFKKGITEKVYRNHSALLWDIVPVVKAEIAALVADGVQYVQIDAPRYSYYIDPKWRDYVKSEMGVEPDAALDEAIKADNACLASARQAGTTLASVAVMQQQHITKATTATSRVLTSIDNVRRSQLVNGSCGIHRISSGIAAATPAAPTTLPARAIRRLSTRHSVVIRIRLAPSATRTAVSFVCAALRARSRPPTFAQTINSRSPVPAIRTIRAVRN